MIYKYNLGIPYQVVGQGYFQLPIPLAKVKKVLDIQMQGSTAVLWAEVEEDDFDNYLEIVIVWTGFEEPATIPYFKTIQEPSAGLVYHYYVRNPMENCDL